MKRVLLLLIILMTILLGSCGRPAERASYNLSRSADSFEIPRRLIVLNLRANDVIFQMQGNFSISTNSDKELVVTGMDENNNLYKHFIYLPHTEVTYIVEQIAPASISRFKYELRFNPEMIIPFDIIME